MSIAIPPRPAVKADPVVKAGPVGPGAGVLNTEFPLSTYGRISPQKKMQTAWTLSFEVPWIALAEDAIGDRFAGVDWHLEDENDETIDDAYPNPDAQAARMLLEKPSAGASIGAPFYRSELWALTCRAMGICGSAFIFLDSMEVLAKTPSAMLPIAPWRMYPEEDPRGNLIGWSIDKTAKDPGIPVRLDQILHYQLRRNFSGHFGVGNVEVAMKKAGISQGLDDHVNLVLSAGGRLSGILSPSVGVIGDDQMLAMERDWRTVVEQSDAAKRLQLVRAPVKFDRTTLTPDEMQLRDMMVGARDDLLTIWSVPASSVGAPGPVGLNSGDTKKYDNQTIWQGPVHHRLGIFREGTQYQLLDRYAARGATVELEIEEPEFEDDSPRYDLLGKSLNTPMRTVERRELIGLPPLGDPALDNAILLPSTIVPYAQAPDEATEETPPALGPIGGVVVSAPTPQLLAAGETTNESGSTAKVQVKAAPVPIHARVLPLHRSLTRYREHAQATMTPLLKRSVQEVLQAQRHDIADKLRRHAAHVASDPADTSAWFARGWDAKLRAALAPRLEAVAHVVNAQVHDVLPAQQGKAAPPGAVERVMHRGAARVTKINETTRNKIKDAIIRGLDDGMDVLEVADLVEAGGIVGGLDLGSLFDDYRAEMIARTELMDAYNATTIGSYSDAGVTQVQAIDGDGDEECAERDGQVFDIDEADTIEDHPNGTLDWVPVVGDEEGKAIPFAITRPTPPAAVYVTVEAAPTPNVEVNVPAPLVTVEAAPTPNVTVEAPIIHVPAPVLPAPVVIPAPVVNVEASVIPAPVVNVETPNQKRRRMNVTKGRDGTYTVEDA